LTKILLSWLSLMYWLLFCLCCRWRSEEPSESNPSCYHCFPCHHPPVLFWSFNSPHSHVALLFAGEIT
jgi:hypothetical protein